MDLNSDPVYKDRLAKGLVKAPQGATHREISASAKKSVWIFLIGVIAVVLYASAISPAVGIVDPVIVGRDAAIMGIMLTIGTLITVMCKIHVDDIASCSVFKSGMVACVCVLGVAWLGNTFVAGHTKEITDFSATTVAQYPALLAVIFFFAAMLLYSQAATAKAITPAVVTALGITAALRSLLCPLCSFSRRTRRCWALFRWTTRVQPASVSSCSTTPSSSLACWPSSSALCSVSLPAQCSNQNFC